jgi:hypothetical protein
VKPTNYSKDYVYCVGGKAYHANFAGQTFLVMIWLPPAVALVSHDWRHLIGIVMVAIGTIAANSRFSPVHGCLVWLPLIGLAIWGASDPQPAILLMVWGAAAWLIGCVECRLTLVPFKEDAV